MFVITSSAFAEEWPFPKNEMELGYYNKEWMYFDCPRPPSPIFWKATLKVNDGVQLVYQRLLFHTQKRFSVYIGGAVSRYSFGSDTFYAESVFPAIRYWIIRSKNVAIYFSYSVAGPTILSRRVLGYKDLGGYFIFQDTMGLGLLWGRHHAFHLDVRWVHYSNGDILPQNPGFDVPVMVYLGYSF